METLCPWSVLIDSGANLKYSRIGQQLAATCAVTNNGTWDVNGAATGNQAFTFASLSGSGKITTACTFGSTNTLTIGGTTSTTFSGVIEDGKSANSANKTALVQGGTGTLTLSGPNTFTGGTTVNSGGTLQLGNATALGWGGLQTTTTGGATVASGGVLDLNGTTGINNSITLNATGISANGALINSASGAASIASGLAGLTVAATGSGSGYSSAPAVGIADGVGSGATATASLGLSAARFTVGATGDKVYARSGLTSVVSQI